MKDIIRKIFKSKSWDDILNKYCNNDFIEIDIFKMEEFIEQFFERIKRLISIITCNMISRLTIIDDEREEGGEMRKFYLVGKKK